MISWQHTSSCTRLFCSTRTVRMSCVSSFDSVIIISGYDKKRLPSCVRDYVMSTETSSCLRWTTLTLDYRILSSRSLCRIDNRNNNSSINKNSNNRSNIVKNDIEKIYILALSFFKVKHDVDLDICNWHQKIKLLFI